MDVAALREILSDKREHIVIGRIRKVDLLSDLSCLKVLVSVMPDEERSIVARMTWQAVGESNGIYSFPVVDDLVLVAFAEGDVEQAFVISRLSSKIDKIPEQAKTGDLALVANKSKRSWLTGVKVFLTGSSTEPTQPVPLGTELKLLLEAVLEQLGTLSQAISTHTHAGNLGYPTSPPTDPSAFVSAKSFFDEKKSSPVGDGAILSKVSFTE